jgi:hypothetical protein
MIRLDVLNPESCLVIGLSALDDALVLDLEVLYVLWDVQLVDVLTVTIAIAISILLAITVLVIFL